MEPKICQHLSSIKELELSKRVCEECIKNNSVWVHLRTCQTCGITLCCDSSPNRHMTKHYLSFRHQVVASAEPGERWLWCYEDSLFLEY